VNGFQTTLSNASGNAFLAKIDTTNSSPPVYSTYLGGNGLNSASRGFGEVAFGVAADTSGNAYLAGTTTSTDLATLADLSTLLGPQPTYPPSNASNTVFVSRVDTTKTAGPSLAYLTYLGGEVSEFGNSIALDPNHIAYVTGQTNSSQFPHASLLGTPYQTTKGASGIAFLSLLNTTVSGANSQVYSTFLGGTGGDEGLGIRVDGQGNAYIAGKTQSTDFPHSEGAFQPAMVAGASGNGFISKLNPGGQGTKDLVYSSYFGGGNTNPADIDQAEAIAIDSSNNVYLAGHTLSTPASFPIFPAGAFQTTLHGTSDAFIAKLTLLPTLAISPTSLAFGIQPVGATSAPKTVTLTNNTSDAIPFPGASVTFSGTNAADFGSPSNTCGASIAAGASCTVSVTFTPPVASGESATLVITVMITNGGLSSSQSFDVSLTGTGSATAPGVGFAPTSLSFGGQLLTTTSAVKTVTLTNTGAVALTITSIAVSGDFAQTNTCPLSPATLAAAGTCTISVTFAPTALGARTGTLTVTDDAGGSPHTAPLTGTGWDFTVAAPATVTVKKGDTGSFNVTITPLNGFNQAVTVTCTGTTMPVTCTPVSPVTPADGVTPVTSAVSISAKGMILPPPGTPTPPMAIRQIVPLLLALSLLMCLFRTRRLPTRLGMVTGIMILLALAGCGNDGQVKKVTNLTITASSGGVNKTATVALTIN
jgi:hypothetical protein